MAKKIKDNRPGARLPKGLRDIEAAEIRAQNAMLASIRKVYENYGFEPLETPAFEYTDALGKFLPDSDRPNEGVFSLQDEDEQWLSLRYDMTAPLARYVAENFDRLPKPFRRYATGPVWRNEKPGPGRFRQFTQFDADTVGTESVAADAEMCMLAADTLEALGVPRGNFLIKVNNRKVLDGIMEAAGIAGEENAGRRLTVLRAIDKLDRLGLAGVEQLLGEGRLDESGDYTKGAGLSKDAISAIRAFVVPAKDGQDPFAELDGLLKNSEIGQEGRAELAQIAELISAAGYSDRVKIDPSVVRGLEYYTGPVFEAELTFEVTGDDGKPVRFGSVGGGGRYDDLVARFTGKTVPATGFSLGVSRLQAALNALGRGAEGDVPGPVVVLVMDRDRLSDYQALTQRLRSAGIRAEMYLGTSGMKAQMKYADKRGSPCVVIQGSDEREKGEVQIKDLIEGALAAQSIADNKEWKEARPAQFSVSEVALEEEVRKVLARHFPQSD
ncbi:MULTISPECIES: histidine--tRNA ligase [Filomicrobium]|uniref:Histidine--tRNA ligase n=1 Tax=Filomicrobium insigne TaxID=418854 RepID=A0A1H0LTP3_9HYPH|nr:MULTISPECIES: histidine--tRNA ligase [Filomicrobium]MCV0368735.1 histidine--tRNA ligase [Filomicrobium sp.]SDO71483.1 histidyl-tRNA synthetase [Filomicrobium insigne]